MNASNWKSKSSLLLFVLLFSSLFTQAQYAHYTFYGDDGIGFHMRANGKDIYDGYATNVTVRMNQGTRYDIEFSIPGSNGAVAEEKVFVPADGISASFEMKQKGNGAYKVKLKSQVPAPQPPGTMASNSNSNSNANSNSNSDGGGVKFKMTKTESYSGPDGAYTKSEETEGSFGSGGFNSTTTKSNASIDENGFNSEVSQKQTQIGNASNTVSDIGNIASLAKRNKNKNDDQPRVPVDGRDLVVTDIQYLEGGAAPVATKTTSETPAASGSNAGTEAAQPVKTVDRTPVEEKLPEAKPIPLEAKIGKVPTSGREFYFYNEPARKYEVVFEFSVDNGVLTPEWMGDMKSEMNAEIDDMLDKKRYIGRNVDAIKYTNGSNAEAIVFTEAGNDGLAEISEFKDKLLFLQCEPTIAYDVVKEFDNADARRSPTNLSMAMNKIVLSLNKEFPDLDYDAVITDDFFDVKVIKFK